jgi:hypothetical protein
MFLGARRIAAFRSNVLSGFVVPRPSALIRLGSEGGGVPPRGSEVRDGVRRAAVEQPAGQRDRQLPRASAHPEL